MKTGKCPITIDFTDRTSFQGQFGVAVGLIINLAIIAVAQVVRAEGQLEQVFQAWRERQVAVRSASFSYSTGKAHAKLSFDSNRMRYEFKGVNPLSSEGLQQDFVGTLDAKESKSLELREHEFPAGHYHQFDTGCRGATLLDSLVLRCAFRAFHTDRAGFDCSGLVPSSQTGSVNGQRCVILEAVTVPPVGAMGGHSEFYWVDPKEGYSIVRYQIGTQGVVLRQIDVENALDREMQVWVPKRWTIALLEVDGRIRRSVECKLVKYELNPTFEESEFAIRFPANTVVGDIRPGASPPHYLLRADGSKRAILASEWNVPYAEVVRTQTGGAPLSSPWRKWLIGCCAIALVSLVGWSVWRWGVRRNTN